MVAATLDPTNHKALHRCATAKRQLGMLEVTADLEAQKRAFQKAKQEKEAKRAATNKSFKYKGGLTIEEHSDEEDSKGWGSSSGFLEVEHSQSFAKRQQRCGGWAPGCSSRVSHAIKTRQNKALSLTAHIKSETNCLSNDTVQEHKGILASILPFCV
eukprot:1145471-Pelagomonas_calceolata.AAC.1